DAPPPPRNGLDRSHQCRLLRLCYSSFSDSARARCPFFAAGPYHTQAKPQRPLGCVLSQLQARLFSQVWLSTVRSCGYGLAGSRAQALSTLASVLAREASVRKWDGPVASPSFVRRR